MLTRIEIRDFALIEHAVLTLGPGLLILTGETGAGKSILIDAISALSGGKIGRDVIRHGQDRASVEAVFQNPAAWLPKDLLNDLGLTDESDEAGEEPPELYLSREILASGKSVCRANGRLVPLNVLKDLAADLIDIHGQHDQQAIFRVETHLQMLDRYGGEAVAEALRAWEALLAQHQACQRQMADLGRDPAERERRADMLRYQVQEIEAIRPKPDEDEKLTQRRRVAANAEKIGKALADACELLNGDTQENVLASLARVISRVEPATSLLPDLADTAGQLRESLYTLQNAADDLRSALEAVECDPGELERLDERLDQLFRLKKKYGGTLPAVQQFLQDARRQLDELADGEARFDRLYKERTKLRQQMSSAGDRLTELRRQAAVRLESQIMVELSELGMKGVRFAVQIEPLEDNEETPAKNGLDRVEFMISANPGEPMKPLARIASGGEASRIMLAVKTILARADRIPVLIFDEIDTGVSGKTAGRVAAKLKQLSDGRQVFCITHLAQIAAVADRHLLIEKTVDGGKTSTRLQYLDTDGRLGELARLLSGGIADETARQLAGQLLATAESVRNAAGSSDTGN